MTDETVGIRETGLDIFRFQPGVAAEDRIGGVSGSQHAKHMFDGQATTSDNGLTTENLRIHGDSLEKELLIHSGPRVGPS
jgi:hypothetical protein